MAEKPKADIATDLALVRRLLEAQHPDLAMLPLELVNAGWDNEIFRLGRDLAVRIPRREAAAHLIEHEQQWLPVLAGNLTTAVPVPYRIGVPSDAFPWPWSVVPWLSGRPASAASRAERRWIAEDLATFFLQLHRPASPDAPANPVRGVPLVHRRADVVARLDELANNSIHRRAELRALWDRAVNAAPYRDEPLWLHGDPHPANLLVSESRLSAVIDFGDLTAGDPATDLAAAWLVFDAEGRAIFRGAIEAGRTVDAATWLRARGWALVIGTALAISSDGDAVFAAMGRNTLDAVLDD
ncbi:aminoglycoside phosphotransferase family protein [Plantibacter sp. YIM 135347]|uniref:aminoglycoside phosphotransferase family protein n=1 Tax=Plantibacter sp. YIM 135347 TaxID=3423919 RepID=UPI003D349072